jgi:hypothetical protein
MSEMNCDILRYSNASDQKKRWIDEMDRVEGERSFYCFPIFAEVFGQLMVFNWACAPGWRNFVLNRFGHPEDGDSTFLRNARPQFA